MFGFSIEMFGFCPKGVRFCVGNVGFVEFAGTKAKLQARLEAQWKCKGQAGC